MEIGLFFGSFNPIHVGHLVIGNHVLNETRIKKVWYVVSPLNPLKNSTSLLNEFIRLNLVQKAIKGDRRLVAKDIEFRLPRPSFTIDSLNWLRDTYPRHKFSMIMGSDSFQSLDQWKNFEEILRRGKILVYQRPGFNIDNKLNADIEILNAPLLGISSTNIRELIQNGKSVRYLVPETVRKEIETNGYFKE